MNNNVAANVHWSFWLIVIIMLLWNIMGVMNYLMQMDPESIASYPETHRAIIEGRPAWATGGFALAVFGGSLGCLLLLLRKSFSFYVFIVSLSGVLVTMMHTLEVVQTVEMSVIESVMMILMPIIVAFFLVWYTKMAVSKGWIS